MPGMTNAQRLAAGQAPSPQASRAARAGHHHAARSRARAGAATDKPASLGSGFIRDRTIRLPGTIAAGGAPSGRPIRIAGTASRLKPLLQWTLVTARP